MKEEDIIAAIRNKKNMKVYMCEADFIKEFCRISTFFNIQVIAFLVSRICQSDELKTKDIYSMIIEAWESNIDETIKYATVAYPSESKEKATKMYSEAKRLAKEYIQAQLDIPPSADDLEKMFKKL